MFAWVSVHVLAPERSQNTIYNQKVKENFHIKCSELAVISTKEISCRIDGAKIEAVHSEN